MASIERHPRMIMSTEGMEGSGKTHFALTAPKPTLYLDFDYGIEGVSAGDGVDRRTYNLLPGLMSEAELTRHVKREMERFIKDFHAGLGAVRTIVVDTFTAAWKGQRLARAEDKYIEQEEEFKSMIRAAYACPSTNVIFIHHLQQDWARNQAGKPYKSQNWSRDGMDGIANAVQMAIKQRYVAPVGGVPGRFEIDVLKCRDNIGMVGQTLVGMDWETICLMAAPTVDWSK